jgi:SAM-dependent methyltransferase
MEKLTEESYWNTVNRQVVPEVEPLATAPSLKKRILKRLLGRRAVLTRENFFEFDLWNNTLGRYIQPNPERTVIEIGSAPGGNLLAFHRHFQYQPWGVEYTANGVEANRRNFTAHGLDPAHVIHADAMAAPFQEEYRERFDVVCSFGFIEHFTDIGPVMDAHVNLLKPGGHLIVSIPNLSGLNYFMVKRFEPELLPLHNLTIMKLDKFKTLFERPSLEPEFCGYKGGLNLLMALVNDESLPVPVRRVLSLGQLAASLGMSVVGSMDAPSISAALLYIGRKR